MRAWMSSAGSSPMRTGRRPPGPPGVEEQLMTAPKPGQLGPRGGRLGVEVERPSVRYGSMGRPGSVPHAARGPAHQGGSVAAFRQWVAAAAATQGPGRPGAGPGRQASMRPVSLPTPPTQARRGAEKAALARWHCCAQSQDAAQPSAQPRQGGGGSSVLELPEGARAATGRRPPQTSAGARCADSESSLEPSMNEARGPVAAMVVKAPVQPSPPAALPSASRARAPPGAPSCCQDSLSGPARPSPAPAPAKRATRMTTALRSSVAPATARVERSKRLPPRTHMATAPGRQQCQRHQARR